MRRRLGDDFGAVNGVAYAGDGIFYAFDTSNDRLLSITTTGVASLLHSNVGAFAGSLTTSHYIPAPGPPALLAFGGLIGMRRRR